MVETAHRQAELVLNVRNATGECPVWCAADQSLYWVDIPAKTLSRYTPASGNTHHWSAPEMLACFAPGLHAHSWIVGAESGMFALETSSPAVLGFKSVAPVQHARPGMRFNDGRCDREGNFLAGTMLMDMGAAAKVGGIYRLNADASLSLLLDGFITPNGMAFSPDGRTMYLSDSHPSVRQVWAYDYDAESATPSNARPYIDMNGFAGRPDGAAMDVDGCYWICGNDAGLVHRYTPQGDLDFSVVLPAKKPAMCAFGGADLRTLYITSIRLPGAPDDALDGGVFAIHLPDVQGMPEPVCSHAL